MLVSRSFAQQMLTRPQARFTRRVPLSDFGPMEDVPLVIDASTNKPETPNLFARQLALSVAVYLVTRTLDHYLFGRKS